MDGCHIKPEQFFNLIFGYYDRYCEAINGTSTGTDSTYASGSVVPAGEVWVVEAIYTFHDDPTARPMDLEAYNGTTFVCLIDLTSVAQWVWVVWNGKITLKAGDRVRARGLYLTSGKSVGGTVWGYKMKLSQ